MVKVSQKIKKSLQSANAFIKSDKSISTALIVSAIIVTLLYASLIIQCVLDIIAKIKIIIEQIITILRQI